MLYIKICKITFIDSSLFNYIGSYLIHAWYNFNRPIFHVQPFGDMKNYFENIIQIKYINLWMFCRLVKNWYGLTLVVKFTQCTFIYLYKVDHHNPFKKSPIIYNSNDLPNMYQAIMRLALFRDIGKHIIGCTTAVFDFIAQTVGY